MVSGILSCRCKSAIEVDRPERKPNWSEWKMLILSQKNIKSLTHRFFKILGDERKYRNWSVVADVLIITCLKNWNDLLPVFIPLGTIPLVNEQLMISDSKGATIRTIGLAKSGSNTIRSSTVDNFESLRNCDNFLSSGWRFTKVSKGVLDSGIVTASDWPIPVKKSLNLFAMRFGSLTTTPSMFMQSNCNC